MGIFLFLVPIFILTSEITARDMKYGYCQNNICDVMTKLSEDDYKREEFETNLVTFAKANNLEAGHEALKEELETMGHIFNIGKDKPLQAYLMRLLKIIQEETYNKTEQLLEDEAVYISQEFRDLERSIKNKFDEQDKNTAAISKELDRKLDPLNFEKKIKEQEKKSSAISEVLKLMTEKLDHQEKKSSAISDVLKLITEKLDDQEKNTGVKFDSLAMNLKVKLEVQDNTSSAISDVLKLMTEKLDDIQSNLSKFDQEIQKVTKKLRPSDCSDLLTTGTNTSGVYTIYPLSIGIKVYCDMESNGGGWTVFSNRLKQTTAENFNRPWEQYKEGFGNADNEYWMGNEALYAMTNSRDYTLRVDASIISKGWTVWGEWAHFKVQSEDDKYKLSVSGYETTSSLKDSTITYHHGMYFTTLDRDNDNNGANCAASYKGAFWHNSCFNLGATASYSQMYIFPWSVTDSTSYRTASHLQMKIRPRICSNKISVSNLNTHNCFSPTL